MTTGSGVLVIGASPPFSAGLGPSDVLLLAVDDAGAVDPTFGDGGRVAYDIGQPGLDTLTVAARLPDGDILVAGDTRDGVLAGRYGADGTPDADNPSRRCSPTGSPACTPCATWPWPPTARPSCSSRLATRSRRRSSAGAAPAGGS